MDWRAYYKRNNATLLTLPGASLCSLPLSWFGWPFLEAVVPFARSFDITHQFIIPAAYVLAPLAIVCSTIAMVRFAQGRGNVGPFTALLLVLFNFMTINASILVVGFMVLRSKWYWEI
jgi:hypothetical protein